MNQPTILLLALAGWHMGNTGSLASRYATCPKETAEPASTETHAIKTCRSTGRLAFVLA